MSWGSPRLPYVFVMLPSSVHIISVGCLSSGVPKLSNAMSAVYVNFLPFLTLFSFVLCPFPRMVSSGELCGACGTIAHAHRFYAGRQAGPLAPKESV